jgi:hypothetical protein
MIGLVPREPLCLIGAPPGQAEEGILVGTARVRVRDCNFNGSVALSVVTLRRLTREGSGDEGARSRRGRASLPLLRKRVLLTAQR